MNLSTIVKNIKDRINTIPYNEPIFIYIGIGTYAGLKNNNGILEQQNYHQYPPFLQNLKNIITDLNLFIILIDPIQEEPPYMVHDKGLVEEIVDNNIKLYSSNDRKINVYSLHQNIYTDPYERYDDYVNITQELRDLNNYVIHNQITLLYHDFTGRRNSILSEYFDKEIGHSLNHVIYGMSSREDHGCYFDLSVMSSFFPFRCIIEPGKRIFIELFNIYNYIVNDKINSIPIDSRNFPVDMIPLINTQIEQVITIVRRDLTNNIMSLLRILFRLINGDEKYENINIDYSFNFFPSHCKQEFLKLYHDKYFQQLYDKIIDYFSKDMDIVAKLKKYDISGKEILLFITHGNNPYEWYNNIKQFF
jgi:hypothetical protein